MRAAVLLAAVSILALAACDRDRKAADAPGAPDAPARPGARGPAGPPPGPVAPGDLPRRNPGLWETTISVQGEGRVTTTRLCLDAATEAKQSVWGEQASRDMCQKYEMTRQLDGGYRFVSSCNMGPGGVTRSEGVASGDLTSNYTIRMKSTTSGAELELMNRDSEFTIASRRIGPCEAGQRPGDMIMNGRVVANVNEMPGMGGTPAGRR